MDIDREKRFHDLLVRALETPTEERSRFLLDTCQDDPELRTALQELLDAEAELSALQLPTAALEAVGLESEEQTTAAPAQVGPYTLGALLGEGGMGRVFLAEQREPVHRRVAIKILRFTASSREAHVRFAAEQHAMGRLDHPNIGTLLEAGITPDGLPFFAMEFIDGVPITVYCDEQRLSLSERLRLFVDVCRATEHAHQKLLLHRDIKPSNILVTEVGGQSVVKLIDFGIAKGLDAALVDTTLATGDRLLGTPAYMSPEALALGRDVDTRSDVYSLGVVLYELLTGYRPWVQDRDNQRRRAAGEDATSPSARVSALDPTSQQQVAQHRRDGPDSLRKRLRGDLDRIALTSIAHEASQRYRSAAGLADDIERFLADEPIAAQAPTAGYLLRKLMRRHRGRFIAVALVAVALVLGSVGTTIGLLRSRAEADRANREAESARIAQQRSETLADFMIEIFQSANPDRPDASSVTARELLDRGAERLQSELADTPRVRASLERAIAKVYLVWGLPRQAEPLFRSALTTLDVAGAPADEDLLAILADWANISQSMGRYQEAADHAERALSLVQPDAGHSDDFVARLEYWAGIAHLRLNHLDEAERHLRNMLAVLADAPETHRKLIASAHMFIGRTYHKQGRYQEALRQYEHTLQLREGHASQRSLANTHWVIGQTQSRLGRDDEAEASLQRAIALSTEALGADSTHVAGQLMSLGTLFHKQERYTEAIELLRRALAIERHRLPSTSFRLASTLNNLAESLMASGASYDQFAPLFQEAKGIVQSVFPDSHPARLMMLHNMGQMENAGGHHARAETWLRQGIAWLESHPDPDAYAVEVHLGLLESLHAQGRLPAARVAFERALAYFEAQGDEAAKDRIRHRDATMRSFGPVVTPAWP